MNSIDAVLFDYGMVLSGHPDPEAWARMRTIAGLHQEIFHREYWSHRHAYDRGDLNADSYWKKVAACAGILTTPTQQEDLIVADVDYWSTLNPPMLDWVRRLQQAGIRTGILSNMPHAMETGLRARHPWIESFDHHTWSHSLNLAKPEAAIYAHAARGLHTTPENILFIDDKIENVDAALASGMQAIQYSTHARFEEDMRARGFASLLQLDSRTTSQNGKL
jgi:putative hydrolase of the HAD superfamily